MDADAILEIVHLYTESLVSSTERKHFQNNKTYKAFKVYLLAKWLL